MEFLFVFPLIAGVMLAGAAVALGFARHPAARWLAFELVICALWLLAGWGELSASDADLKYEWYRFRYATSVFSAPFLLFTVAELVGDRRWVRLPSLVAFLAPYVISLPFAFTLKEHTWLRKDLHLAQALGLEWWVGTPGPLAWVAMATSYLADVLVLWLLVRAIRQHRGTERAEFATLFGVSLFPAALDLLARFNVGPLPGFNLAPFALVPSFAAVVWMFARFDTFDVMSAMHTLLLHRIPSPVFVVDDEGLVLEANDAAATVLGHTAPALRGRPTAELTTLFAGEAPVIELGEGVERRWFRRSSTELTDRRGRRRGTMWVFDDVTAERLRAEEALAVARLGEEKRHARQLELLVRDLHDGVGGSTASVTMLAALGLKEDAAGKDTALRRIQHLAMEGSADIRSLLNSLENEEPTWPALLVDFRSHGVGLLERSQVAFSFRVEGTPPRKGPSLYAGVSLFRLYKEVLTNVVKHAQATRVEVVVTFTGEQLVMVVRDDGVGLPPPEVRPQGRGLRNISNRAVELGGTVRFEPTLPAGLTVQLALPLPLHSPVDAPAQQGRP